MKRRILSIDGGGIKGVFPASFLASIEEGLERPVADYFDLIVGTSTGGIIALGLGLGLTAKEVLQFYETHGPAIFSRKGRFHALRRFFRAKYDCAALERALSQVFHTRKLGESKKRLVIPSLNIETGEVHIWKTAHSARFGSDFKHSVVEVALSTAAAPTYFSTYVSPSGTPLIDGGVWANNPVAIAAVEGVGILGWAAEDIRILSLGCTTTPLDLDWGRSHSLGIYGWAKGIIDVFMTAQCNSATGMAQHLLADRANLVRINPSAPKNRYALDDPNEIASLKGRGDFEARNALPKLRAQFFEEIAMNDFVPFHKL